eukprot:5848768-Amphidinium_carterae.1
MFVSLVENVPCQRWCRRRPKPPAPRCNIRDVQEQASQQAHKMPKARGQNRIVSLQGSCSTVSTAAATVAA